MQNSFFKEPYTETSLSERIRELNKSKVGFYSIGLYPASLAYNCVMQTEVENLLLAPRPGREILGAFSKESLEGMNEIYLNKIERISNHFSNGVYTKNTLSYLILNCELVILSSNSNHIESDLRDTLELRKKLNRDQVVIACLVGSFCNDSHLNKSYVLCEKESNLGFFSGFHRHGALLNEFDSFTANFCHPDALTAMLGAKMLDSLSPNIQVSSGVHNLEGQYIKASKNISSIFAGFAHTYHQDNPGLLPTILTLLLDQCLDQAATVSMCRKDIDKLYKDQYFPITELGYGVQHIEASLLKDGDLKQVRDHTFSQLTAMVADVRGSMMLPVSGKPTRNFQAGQVLAEKMNELKRCPLDINEFIVWCENSSLKIGGLEGIKSLKYWPQIKKSYLIEFHDSSMINLLYMCILGSDYVKDIFYKVMTESRQLSNFCQESVRPSHSRKYANAISNLENDEAIKLIVKSIISKNNSLTNNNTYTSFNIPNNSNSQPYFKAMNIIEQHL
ncbi:hypothetical protein [Prochlorococcus sp. MIT 1223]|uniref:hypothetical protein n=1 Tax=Prochlorococcus sp. MIT 1223 TaxID=3096217 RepID=UPI002A74D0F6|nr:hypothetical protein [Prochlorococcus sp. MIT 1223]